jgi:hypothetical protein
MTLSWIPKGISEKLRESIFISLLWKFGKEGHSMAKLAKIGHSRMFMRVGFQKYFFIFKNFDSQ